MWCVASAPIVPLARDLDAALGMPRGELPFISASCPRHSPPPHSPSGCTRVFSTHRPRHSSLPHSPLGLHTHFFHKVPCHFLAPPSLSRAAPAFFPQGALPLRLSAGSLRAFPHLRHVPPRSTPLPPRRHRSDGNLSSENTKKRAPFLGERCSFWMLSGRHSAAWC